MKKQIGLLVVLFLVAQWTYAQNFPTEKLDSYFETLADNNKFMGSVAIFKNDKIIYTKQVGKAAIEYAKKPDANTKYRIGSISKTFTATLVFKAIEEGKLHLTDKLAQYFPTITNAKDITIANLLNHHSGIHNFTDDAAYLSYHTKPKTQEEMLAIIQKGGADFKPNKKGSYSNANYVLLSYILEKVYKKSYAELLKLKITKPLGLKNTYFGGKITLENNECYSYSYNESWKKEAETDTSIPMGAGGLVSTPSDLLLFANALFNAKIINNQSLKIMKTLTDNYGMGLFQIPFHNKKAYGHSGGIDGFVSNFGYFTTEQIGVSFISNGTNYNTNNIMITMLNAVFDKPFKIPSFKRYAVSEEVLQSYVGIYTSEQIPLIITISKSGKTLSAQAKGQAAFSLDATAKDKFEFELAGIVMLFDSAKKQFILKQGGKEFTFTKG